MADTKIETKQDGGGANVATDRTPTHAPEHRVPANKDLAARNLPMPRGALGEVLEQKLRVEDQRQEQALYSGVWAGWSGIVAAMVKTPSPDKSQSDRQKLEMLQEELFHALAKEKKKKSFRESPIFQRLVSVMGPEVAESVTAKLENAISNNPSGLQSNSAALTQVAKDLATVLEKNKASLKISTNSNQLQSTLETEISHGLAIQPSLAAPLRAADEKVKALHAEITSLTPGKDQMVKVLEMYGTMKREEFTALLDAYDKTYGIPLVDHVAQMSGSSPTARAEVFEELVSVLTPDQRARHLDYGRAELGLALASLSVEQKNAEEGVKAVKAALLKTASHLGDASLLNIPDIAQLSVAERKAALEATVRREFPGLKDAKDWQGIIKAMTSVQKDGPLNQTVTHNDQLAALIGKSVDGKDEPAIRERIARITLLMGDLIRYEEQVGQLGKIAVEGNSNEIALLTSAYNKMYGKEVSDSGSGLHNLVRAAQSHLDGLAHRISDPRTSDSERRELVRERDAIEFSSVKTRLGIHLQGDKPDVARAQALLAVFENSEIDTPLRRDATYRQVASDLSRAITAADEYRKQWLTVTPDALRPVAVVKEPASVNCASHHEKPRDISREQIRSTFLALSEKPALNEENPLLYFKSETERKKSLAELEGLARDAAKTQWFAEVLNPGYVLTKTKAATADQLQALLDKKKEASGRELDSLGRELDLVHERARAGLWAIEQSSHSAFLSQEWIAENRLPLSSGVRSKIGSATQAELAQQLSRHLDPETAVDVSAATISTLRLVARDDKTVQAVLVSVKPDGEPNAQLSDILARLAPADALRVKAFTNLHASGRLPGDPKVVFEQLAKSSPEVVAQVEAASRAEAKMLELDRVLEPLNEQERLEVREAFMRATGTTIGARARALIPTGPTREQGVVALIQSKLVVDGDIREFFDETMPATTAARVQAIRQAFGKDTTRTQELLAISFPPSTELTELAVLRAAAQVGGAVSDHNVVEESIRALAPYERAADLAIESHVKRFDPGFAARQGVRTIAKARQEQTVVTIATQAVHPDKTVASNATVAVSHLGSDPARADAVYHQIRQANFSSSEMLLFRAFYRDAALNRKPEEKTRPLTGDFEKDLASAKAAQTEYEKVRNAALVKGGSALKDADRLAVKNISSLSEEQQLGALIDLKKSGELDAHKKDIDSSKLKGDAKAYHAAVTDKPKSKEEDSNSKVRAEALELKHKVAVKGATEHDAVALVSGKSAAQMAEIKKVYPKVGDDLKVIAPKIAGEVDGLLSASEAEQRKAVERAMMNSLKNPIEFERMLGLARSQEAKQEIIASLERSIAHNGRHFAPNESAIVQFVRSQRSDFREIDGVLFADVLARHGFAGHKLEPQMAQQLLALRHQGAAQLEKMDAFHNLRSGVVKDAMRYSGDKATHLGNAEADKANRLVTGWLRNDEIRATKDLINHHNRNTLTPMLAGEVDIRRSRELMRMGVAIIAQDMQQGIDGGVTLASTQQVMNLNMRRDKEISYKVFDEAKEKIWKTQVSETEKWVGYADTAVMVGMMVAKTAVVTGATLYGSPVLGLAVATAWNVGDKTYRVALQGESMRSALVSGSIEFGLDLLFAGASAYAQSRVVFQAGKTAEKAVEGTSKVIREWRWLEPVVKPTQVEQVVEKGILWRTAQSDKLRGLFAEVKNGAKIGEAVAETGAAFQASAIKSQLAGAIDAIPEWMGVGSTIWRKGGGGVPSELARLLSPLDKEDPGAGVAKTLHKTSGQGAQGSFRAAGEAEVVSPVVALDTFPKEQFKEQVAVNPPPQPWQAPLTLWSYVVVVEQALIAKPDPDLQAALDNLKGLIASPTVTEADALAAARRVQDAIEAAKERDKDKPEWSPYPDLAKALDGWLDAGNPWLALGGALFTYQPGRPPEPPPVIPPPVAPAPPVQPPKPPPPPAGRPGPGLQIAMAPVGGMNGNGSGNSYGQKEPTLQGQELAALNGIGSLNVSATPNANGVATVTAHVIPNVNGDGLANVNFTSQANRDLIAQRAIVIDTLAQMQGSVNIATISASDTAEAAKLVQVNRQANLTATTQGWVAEVAEATALRDRESGRLREGDPGAHVERKATEQGETTISVAKVAGLDAPIIKHAKDSSTNASLESDGDSSSVREHRNPREHRGEGASQHLSKEEVSTERALKGTQTKIAEGESSTSRSAAGVGTREDGVIIASVGQAKEHSSATVAMLRDSVVAETGVSEASMVVHAHHSVTASSTHVARSEEAPLRGTAAVGVGVETTHRTPQTVVSDAPMPPEIRAILRGEEHEAHADDMDGTAAAPSSRPRQKRNAAADARLRATILRQLMEAHFTKVQREKLLKMLIALGLSESEYRSLVIKLGEMDVAKKAEQQKPQMERLFEDELDEQLPIEPVKVAVPAMKAVAPAESRKEAPQEPKTSRAELYRRLREESVPRLKGD